MTPIKNVVKVAKDYIYLQCLQNIGKIKKYFCDIIRVRRTPDFVTGYLDTGIPVNYLKIWYFDLSKIYKSRRENSKSRKFFKMLIINIKISMKNKKGIKDKNKEPYFCLQIMYSVRTVINISAYQVEFCLCFDSETDC